MDSAKENLLTPLGIRASDVRWNFTLTASNAATFAQLYLRPRDLHKLGGAPSTAGELGAPGDLARVPSLPLEHSSAQKSLRKNSHETNTKT